MRGCPLTIDVSRLEQFHLWSENCLWHSCTASSIPKRNIINKDQKGLLEASIFQIFAYPLVSGILDLFFHSEKTSRWLFNFIQTNYYEKTVWQGNSITTTTMSTMHKAQKKLMNCASKKFSD